MALDLLFIHPGTPPAAYQDLARAFTAVDPPLWACLLAGAMRQLGFTVALHDINTQGWDAATRERCLALSPRLVVILAYGHHPSASTQTMPAVRSLLRDLKAAAPELPVALGGTHPAALPELTLRQEQADYILLGDGRHALAGLLEHLRGARALDQAPGLWHRTGTGCACTGAAQPLDRLAAELPGPAWDLLPDLTQYRAHNWHCFQYFEQSRDPDFMDVRSPYASLYTSLGCPYSCDYCCIHTLFGRPGLKHWPVETVMGWIDDLAQHHGIRNLRLADELFLAAPGRVERFCDLLIARGYDLNIWAYARVDSVPVALLPHLRKAGVQWICLGIESASAAVLSGVHKTARSAAAGAVRALQDNGIHVLGNYMFGLPDDDRDTLQQTLDLALELQCEFANFYTVMPYPGSALYARAEAAGQAPDRWEAYAQLGYWTQPLPTRHLPVAEVLAFRDHAFRTYFTDAGYLRRVRKIFGAKVCAHLADMVTIPVKRYLAGDVI